MNTAHYADAQAWQRDRTRFNHDWLMVSFLTFLQAWSGDLDAAGAGAPLPPEAEQHLREWPRYRERLQALLDAAEWALGPAGQESGTALSLGMPAEVRSALLAQAHGAWRECSGIGARLQALNALVREADQLVLRLLERERAEGAGASLYSLFLHISRGLSSLPSAGYLP